MQNLFYRIDSWPDCDRICISSCKSDSLELGLTLIEGEDHDVGAVLLLQVRGPGEDLVAARRPPEQDQAVVIRDNDLPI